MINFNHSKHSVNASRFVTSQFLKARSSRQWKAFSKKFRRQQILGKNYGNE